MNAQDEYKRARRANLEAAERLLLTGQMPTVTAQPRETPPPSEVFEKPKGWRKFVFSIRRRPTLNTAVASLPKAVGEK